MSATSLNQVRLENQNYKMKTKSSQTFGHACGPMVKGQRTSVHGPDACMTNGWDELFIYIYIYIYIYLFILTARLVRYRAVFKRQAGDAVPLGEFYLLGIWHAHPRQLRELYMSRIFAIDRYSEPSRAPPLLV